MEPQNPEQVIVAPEEKKEIQAEKSPVAVSWKKPLITMLLIGGLALGLMLLVKYL
ncbi:MAG: hypothetical protein WAX66_02565 [Patescibacteria group bacterium]